MPNFSKPKSVVDQIYLSISDAITNGLLEPGCRLTEQQLQKDFGVSRSPIREAIRRLEAEGLVVVDAYKKTYVRILTRKDLTDSVLVLANLESLSARLAAANATAEDIAELKEINQKIQEAYSTGQYSSCAELNFAFHRFLIRLADNDILRTAIRAIFKKNLGLWLALQFYEDKSVIVSSIEEHAQIIDAFEHDDGQLAEATVKAHVENTLKRFLRQSKFDNEGLYRLDSTQNQLVASI